MDSAARRVRIINVVWFFGFAVASSVWCLTATDRLSATFDEPVYVLSGLEHWRSGSYQALMKLGTMPLPVDVETLPLYASERWTGQQIDPGSEFAFRVARTASLVFWWLLLVYVWRLGRLLGGDWAARIAVALAACEPTLLGHAGLATTDVAVAACLLVLVYHFRTGRESHWLWRVGLPGICYGVALLAKASALVFGPLLLIVLELERLVRLHLESGQDARSLLTWGFVAQFLPTSRFGRELFQIVAIGLVLTFVYVGSDWQPQRSFVAWASGLPEGPHAERMRWLAENLRIFPNAGEGLVRQIKHNMHGHGTYLLGRSEPRAIWYYFPVALSMKLSPTLLLLPALLLVLRPRYLLNFATVAVIVLLLFSLTCRVQIGVRFFLPLMAFLAVGAAAGLAKLLHEPAAVARRVTAVAILTLAFATITAAAVWPHGLSYVNPFWGGPREGYRLLSDSNYDWGQGLKELAEWQDREGGDVPMTVWYFGSDPLMTRLPMRYLPLHNAKVERPDDVEKIVGGGRLAVGITMVHGMVCDTPAHWKALEYLRCRRPVARTTTFFIYDIRNEQRAVSN
jgi:4-amino-4-deoxy-L-arabinose transferase-like glycosyltransferase